MKKIFSGLLVVLQLSMVFASIAQSKNYTDAERNLILELYDIGVLQFDLSSIVAYKDATHSDQSPYYVDLRHIISYPTVHRHVVELLAMKAKSLSFDTVCGVPYAALATASDLAYELNVPLIMRRAYRKTYGTCKKIEGIVSKDALVLVIDDVITTGSSMLETIQDLEAAEMVVRDCLVLFDRQQGGVARYRNKGYKVHTLFTIEDFLKVLLDAKKLDATTVQEIMAWTVNHQIANLN